MVPPDISTSHDESRFQFGANWLRFLALLNADRIEEAETSLKQMLEVKELKGKRFLDAGSGSGLFSLAARNLGASVHSFDYDDESVACTEELRRRYWPDDNDWMVERGDALDQNYLNGLGRFDVVYSWGVLHHTGDMWSALENIVPLVNPGGKLFIAIYNDQGRTSHRWLIVKRTYNRLPGLLRWIVLGPAFARLWGPTMMRDLVRGQPFATWRNYGKGRARGMDPWRDVVDWVGGYPFEVAKSEQIVEFFQQRGFVLVRLRTCGGGHGCNEFVLQRAG